MLFILIFTILVLLFIFVTDSITENKIYSQNGEDGVTTYLLQHLFKDDSKYFYVEFGVEDGTECNTRMLRDLPNWSGLLMDGSHENKSINLNKEFITKDNIVSLLNKYNVPKHINLLSVDIDYNDFYVLHEILKYYTCDVIICEYNSIHKPSEDKVVIYSADTMWDGTNYFGSSLLALQKLCKNYGYELFYCDKNGVNAFFVKSDYGLGRDIYEVYMPPGWGNGAGHPKDDKERTYVSSQEAMEI